VAERLAGAGGPVLLVAPDVPGLDGRLVEAALGDLADGCAAAFGASHDARPYLVALARPEPELLSLARASFEGGVIGAMAERGRLFGLLRPERRLASAADARALALDPCAPAELARLVRVRPANRR